MGIIQARKAAVRGVLQVGMADAPLVRKQHVSDVGKPGVGVGFEEEAGFGDALNSVGGDGVGGEGAGSAVGVEG